MSILLNALRPIPNKAKKMPKVPKFRLDELVVAKGLADSRSQAKALILAGKVKLGTERLDKPGRSFPEDSEVTVEAPPRFVSRGGEKLEGFLDRFEISMAGLPILDVGASTGGFTDCSLQRGAISATCVDVGRAQMHNKLIQDERVTNIEKTNARHLQPGDLPRAAYPRIVMDLSFISLTKVLPAVWQFIEMDGILIALVKPQFEAEKHEVDAGRGIIRNETIHQRVLAQIQDFALTQLPGAKLIGTMDSPIKGTDGNREFLLGLRRHTIEAESISF
jgi:23S rRNA (cytidine1920-2'-O)/16S rRNA (cytidine1409-2'-O)-methyltransferase